MFEGADLKLQIARVALMRLRTFIMPSEESNIRFISGPSGVCGESVGVSNPVLFSEAFSSCIAQVRSVGDAVLKENKLRNDVGFNNWKKVKKNECYKDDLLKFINDKRNSDLHEGLIPLVFTMHVFALSNNNIEGVPFPGAQLRIDGTGLFWIVDQGKLEERRVPCDLKDGYKFTAAVIDPPRFHKGKPMPKTDPISICATSERYYAELLFEARNRFG